MQDDVLQSLADRMKALANPTRLRILLALRDGALCPCQLSAVLDLPEPIVSGELAALIRAGIVGKRRRGRFVRFALHRRDGSVPWLRLVARQASMDPRVSADLDRAGRIRRVPAELLVASTRCEAGHGGLALRPLASTRPPRESLAR